MSSERPIPEACATTREQIDRLVSGELDPSLEIVLREHLATCAECSAIHRERVRVRQSLKRAVDRELAPPELRASIARELRRKGSGGTLFRLDTWRGRTYAAAAVILLLVAGWGVLRMLDDSLLPPQGNDPALARVMEETSELLKVGLGDHVFCAIKYNFADKHFSFEEMAKQMGPDYIGLVPIVREKTPGFEVVVAHQCSYKGRRFVHMIMKKGEEVVSIAITKKKGESFPKDPRARVDEVAGIPLFQAKLQDLREFEVTGFETRDYLAFIVSDLGTEENIRLAAALAPEVHGFLQRVKV